MAIADAKVENECGAKGKKGRKMNDHQCVFISHSSNDNEIVLRFAEALRNAMISYWLDLNLCIPPGSSYANEIIKGIDAASVFLLFYSVHVAIKPDDVLNELEEAKRTHKVIIPVRLDNAEYTGDFKYHLNRIQWIDAANKDEDAAKGEVVAAVRRALQSLGISAAGDNAQQGNCGTFSPPGIGHSSYASAWRLVPHTFKHNEGVAFPAQWDGMLEAFWKAWCLKTEETRRAALQLFLAADQHDPEIQYRIGLMLLLGWFGDGQRNGARAWLEAAAANDHYMAMLEIGNCFDRGSCGFGQNHTLAQQWCGKSFECMKRAASKGDGRAMFNAGRLCRWFFDVARPQEGIEWWEKSAKLGNAEAQSWLAGEYKKGEYVPRNLNKSVSLIVDSAIGGLISSMAKMGRFCKEGVPGVMDVSLSDAIRWYQTAQEHAGPQKFKNEIDELASQI